MALLNEQPPPLSLSAEQGLAAVSVALRGVSACTFVVQVPPLFN